MGDVVSEMRSEPVWQPTQADTETQKFIVYTFLELRISTRLNLADEDHRGTQTENLEA